jgi:ABC-2 type transport system ATP-binding protein
VLLGLLSKDEGGVTLLGGDPWREAAALHRRLAYVPGDVSVWPNLTGGEVIDLLARLRGGLNDQRRRELLERFELDPTKRGRSYSKGNRQKVALVAALASDVELLLLDEPTSGLDPLMEEVFTEYVDAFRDRGGTVLLSSHILAEVEKLCDRVSIIRSGRVVESGTLTDLRHLTRTSIDAELAGPPDGLTRLAGVHDLDVQGHRVRFQVETDALDEAIGTLHTIGLRTLVSQPPTLEELFLRHYGDAVEEQA